MNEIRKVAITKNGVKRYRYSLFIRFLWIKDSYDRNQLKELALRKYGVKLR